MRIIPIFLLPSVALRDRDKLPKSPGVYYACQWWKPWAKPLYIGKAESSLFQRWNGTQYGSHHKLGELLSFYGVRLHYHTTPNGFQARRLEAKEIKALKPRLNRRTESIPYAPLLDLRDAFISLLAIALLALAMSAIIAVR
jgi:excinuclease UvrABC nuclease subunit